MVTADMRAWRLKTWRTIRSAYLAVTVMVAEPNEFIDLVVCQVLVNSKICVVKVRCACTEKVQQQRLGVRRLPKRRVHV